MFFFHIPHHKHYDTISSPTIISHINIINLEKERSKKPKGSKFKITASATSVVTSIKSKEDRHRFKVRFKNELDVPINVYWIDHKGKEVQKKECLAPGEDFSQYTYFTHPWIFRRSEGEDKTKLLADGNGIQSLVFEGEKFLAIPNEKMLVIIAESKWDIKSF